MPTRSRLDLGVADDPTHATHVSGIVLGAVNDIGIHGVAPEAKLYEAGRARRAAGRQDRRRRDQPGDGGRVQWLADQSCKVINMSLGGGDRSQSEEALYNQVRKIGTLSSPPAMTRRNSAEMCLPPALTNASRPFV